MIGGAKTDKVIGRPYPEINKDKSRGEGKKNMGNGISGDFKKKQRRQAVVN